MKIQTVSHKHIYIYLHPLSYSILTVNWKQHKWQIKMINFRIATLSIQFIADDKRYIKYVFVSIIYRESTNCKYGLASVLTQRFSSQYIMDNDNGMSVKMTYIYDMWRMKVWCLTEEGGYSSLLKH